MVKLKRKTVRRKKAMPFRGSAIGSKRISKPYYNNAYG